MMKRIVFLILIMLVMNGCSIVWSVHKHISKPKETNVSFNYLPVEVQEFFYNSRKTPLSERYEFSSTELLTFNTAYEYQFKTIALVKDLWISHYLLIDKTNNVTYRINYNIPRPVIVYDKKLYIPTQYNVFSVREDNFETLTFDRYSLENKKLRRKEKKAVKGIQ